MAEEGCPGVHAEVGLIEKMLPGFAAGTLGTQEELRARSKRGAAALGQTEGRLIFY